MQFQKQIRDPSAAVQIGDSYLDPELFLLQKNDTAIANLWLSEPRRVLYWQPHWPTEFADIEELAPTDLPSS